MNQRIAEALQAKEKGHWACVDLGGTALWAASASVALAECPFSLALPWFISQTQPDVIRP